MKFRIAPVAAVLAALTMVGAAHAEKDYSVWGPKVGIYMPSSSEIRDIFGNNWVSFGLTPREKVRSDRWNFAFDVGLLYADRNGSSLLLIPATAGYSKRFGREDSPVVPYAAARAGLAYYDYNITRPGPVRYDANKVDLTGNVELGVIFNQKLTVSARYDWYAESDGFNFDGLTIWAQFLVFKF